MNTERIYQGCPWAWEFSDCTGKQWALLEGEGEGSPPPFHPLLVAAVAP